MLCRGAPFHLPSWPSSILSCWTRHTSHPGFRSHLLANLFTSPLSRGWGSAVLTLFQFELMREIHSFEKEVQKLSLPFTPLYNLLWAAKTAVPHFPPSLHLHVPSRAGMLNWPSHHRKQQMASWPSLLHMSSRLWDLQLTMHVQDIRYTRVSMVLGPSQKLGLIEPFLGNCLLGWRSPRVSLADPIVLMHVP